MADRQKAQEMRAEIEAELAQARRIAEDEAKTKRAHEIEEALAAALKAQQEAEQASAQARAELAEVKAKALQEAVNAKTRVLKEAEDTKAKETRAAEEKVKETQAAEEAKAKKAQAAEEFNAKAVQEAEEAKAKVQQEAEEAKARAVLEAEKAKAKAAQEVEDVKARAVKEVEDAKARLRLEVEEGMRKALAEAEEMKRRAADAEEKLTCFQRAQQEAENARKKATDVEAQLLEVERIARESEAARKKVENDKAMVDTKTKVDEENATLRSELEDANRQMEHETAAVAARVLRDAQESAAALHHEAQRTLEDARRKAEEMGEMTHYMEQEQQNHVSASNATRLNYVESMRRSVDRSRGGNPPASPDHGASPSRPNSAHRHDLTALQLNQLVEQRVQDRLREQGVHVGSGRSGKSATTWEQATLDDLLEHKSARRNRTTVDNELLMTKIDHVVERKVEERLISEQLREHCTNPLLTEVQIVFEEMRKQMGSLVHAFVPRDAEVEPIGELKERERNTHVAALMNQYCDEVSYLQRTVDDMRMIQDQQQGYAAPEASSFQNTSPVVCQKVASELLNEVLREQLDKSVNMALAELLGISYEPAGERRRPRSGTSDSRAIVNTRIDPFESRRPHTVGTRQERPHSHHAFYRGVEDANTSQQREDVPTPQHGRAASSMRSGDRGGREGSFPRKNAREGFPARGRFEASEFRYQPTKEPLCKNWPPLLALTDTNETRTRIKLSQQNVRYEDVAAMGKYRASSKSSLRTKPQGPDCVVRRYHSRVLGPSR
eukprot:GEMP01017220.1.p1 GENE.GEMP01017220.1~~GEMP01017220.1.p1  ORF type:complete len:850 (+),score=298.93 GEMP01017220.1:206-2551(+)